MSPPVLPASLLAEMSRFLAAQIGLHYPAERLKDLHRGLSGAAQEFGFDDVPSCAQWLLSAPLTKDQVETLAAHLTIGETYFFREPKTLDVIKTHVLPAIIRARRGADRRLRIWSAACCTGEEPYTLAIMLRELLPDIASWHITLLATDLNPRFLAKARAGIYGEWSFRNAPPSLKERWFTPLPDGRFEIRPDIRRMVNFTSLNLMEDSFPSLLNGTNAMDVIFCRNVLMYFAPEQAAKVTAGLARSLVQGGWLVVSPSEILHLQLPQLAPVRFPEAILYKREDHTRVAMAGPEPPAAAARTPGVPPVLREPARAAPAPDTAPQNAAPSLDAASALYRDGRYDEAAVLLRGLLSARVDPHAAALLARVHADQGQLDDALAACDQAIAADRLNAAHYYLRATVLQERGDHVEAAAALRRALFLDPQFVLAHFALGNLTRAQGLETDAGRHFGNALKLLSDCDPAQIVPESDGMTAGRMASIIGTLTLKQTL